MPSVVGVWILSGITHCFVLIPNPTLYFHITCPVLLCQIYSFEFLVYVAEVDRFLSSYSVKLHSPLAYPLACLCRNSQFVFFFLYKKLTMILTQKTDVFMQVTCNI